MPANPTLIARTTRAALSAAVRQGTTTCTVHTLDARVTNFTLVDIGDDVLIGHVSSQPNNPALIPISAIAMVTF